MQSLQSISKQHIHETTIDIFDDWSNLDENTWKQELDKLPQLFKIELAVESQIIGIGGEAANSTILCDNIDEISGKTCIRV